MDPLSRHLEQINKLCTSNKVKSLFAFGSVTRDDFTPASDIDLLIDIEQEDPIAYSDSYFELKFQFEKLFQRDIDLLEQNAIRNPYLQREIDQTKVLIYGS